MKKFLVPSIITAAFIMGCGNGSSVSDSKFSYNTSSIFGYSKNITYKQYVVKAVDDPIVDANVTATNCESYEDLGDGTYLLKKCIAKPLFIEIKNGTIKGTDVKQTFPLILKVPADENDNFAVTPVTTLLATANDNNITALANKLGVDKSQLYSADNAKVKNLFPKINAVLIASYESGAITNTVKFIDTVREEVINNVKNDDLNVSNVLTDVKNVSMSKPNLFGIVIINNNSGNFEDPLQAISKMQNSKEVNFYGLVFDKQIADANVTVTDLNTNKTYDLNISSNNYGVWNFTLDTDSELYKLIENESHLLQFTATKGDIKLTSTITTDKLRSLIQTSKIVSPSKDNSLIISNVTTAQDAILDARGALSSVNAYENNSTELKVYYQDKILKAAAVIKDVVDNNNTDLLKNGDANNTYELITKNINNPADVNFTSTIQDTNTTELEQNITDNTILSSQLNYVPTVSADKFQTVAENAQYVFYRLLAYYKDGKPHTDDNFVREYTKIVVYPSHYETKTCYLDGNSTGNWNCSPSQTVENANFSNGIYQINENNEILSYSLDFNSSVYVPQLNKTYRYYGVIETKQDLTTGATTTTPEILVDSYDVVDAFRRMPTEDPTDFNNLKQDVDPYTNRQNVNIALNRFIKKFMNQVQNYFEDK